jgi:hypothetical protein
MKAFLRRMIVPLVLAVTAVSAAAHNAPRRAQSASAAVEGAPAAEVNEKWMIEGQKDF